MTDKTLLLIDGHSMAFRAFFALPADKFFTKSGQYTNAVQGFANILLQLVAKHQPTHIAVAFDLPGGTFRTRKYAEYKGGRAKTPEPFKGQIELIQQLLTVIGVEWLTVEDYEADDIVATLSQRGSAAGMKVIIASGDKDSYQLVSENVTVSYPMPRQDPILMTPEVVLERTGVTPEQYGDLAALVGEDADNIPGVPGVGPKTAAKWINTYGNLAGIIENADAIGGKVGESLRGHLSQLQLNRELNQLIRDLDIVPDLEMLIPHGVEKEKFHQLCDVLEFRTVRERVLSQFSVRDGDEADAELTVSLPQRELKIQELNSLNFSDFFAEQNSPWVIFANGEFMPARGALFEMVLCANNGESIVLNLAELSVENFEKLSSWLADAKLQKIVHGAKALGHALKAEGLSLAGVSVDTELLAYLLFPDQRKYGLADLVERHLGKTLTAAVSEELPLGLPGEGTNHLNLAENALLVFELCDVLEKEFSDQEQSTTLLELELEVARVLTEIEDRGIAIDTVRLNELLANFSAEVNFAADNAYRAIGDDTVNLSSPKQLQKVLFEDLGLPKTKKTKSGYTTNAEALADLLTKISDRGDEKSIQGVEFLTSLLAHRDAIKLRQSVEGLEKSVLSDGRIHTTYQQTVAATGRLSSTEPNLQNIHARTEAGQQIREVFVPGNEYDFLLTADYSQIEMRLMAHLSGDDELIAAFNAGADLHNFVAAKVFGVAEDDVSPLQRSKIKAMSYGLVYGLSAYGLSAQLGISVPEASNLMADYFERFGKVKAYLDSLVVEARERGYTETILGRRRYLPELSSPNRQVREAAERMALNAPIQGSAADIIKVAMLRLEHALQEAGLSSRILLQVHDELVLEVKREELEQVEMLVRREMGQAFDLSVPLSVGVGVGINWRDAAH
ncbi:MAG: DNA polymerase I [Arcanobacterium sp.]|nr:DNA polymerase I [Arcanobacterium sp.]